MADIEKQNSLIPLSQAVETIKTAILQGQYEALKGTIFCDSVERNAPVL